MITSKTAEWIKDISTKGGLKKILDYERISLCWFYEFGLYYLIEDYIKNQKESESTIKKDTHNFILKSAKYYITSKAITRFFFGKIISRPIKKRQSKTSDTYKVLAVSYTSYWKNFPTPQKENKKANRDTMLGDVITALKSKNFNVAALDEDSSFFVDFKTRVEKRIQEKELWRPVEAYLTFDIIKKVFKTSKKYKEEWNNLKNNEQFIESLNMDYDGFNLSGLLGAYFEKLFKYRTFSPVLDIELMKRAIEVENPDLVLITCGYCQLGRAAVIAGKLEGVPTLEIQHGVIHPSHPGYMHAKNEISTDVVSSHYPIPDKTAVYGHYHKELLTKMSIYPEDRVVVTGQSRYDFLCHANKIYSKEKFLKKYHVNPNHKIILWAPAFRGQNDEANIKDFKTVFKAIQGIKNTTIVIKPHPNDKKRYIKMIKDNLSDYKINAVVAPGSSDTYEQLFVCDLMITRGSTTGMEAVALNKPVIVLNLTGNPSAIDYVEQGVALGVYKPEDLKPTIEKILKNDSVIAKNREKYISKYLYRIDGHATDRVVNLIGEMIRESKSDRNEKLI